MAQLNFGYLNYKKINLKILSNTITETGRLRQMLERAEQKFVSLQSEIKMVGNRDKNEFPVMIDRTKAEVVSDRFMKDLRPIISELEIVRTLILSLELQIKAASEK